MLLYRIPNLLEADQIPTFVVDETGSIEIVDGIARVVLCRQRTLDGRAMFVPQVELHRTVESIRRHAELNRRVLFGRDLIRPTVAVARAMN